MSEYKEYGVIRFYEEDHRYVNWETNEQYLSVTQLLHHYQQEFDSDFQSKKVAKREGKTQEEILAMWKDKSDTATDYGHEIHSFFERMFLSPGRITIPSNDLEQQLLQAYHKTKQLDLSGDVTPEQLVYNHEYKLAGQSDIFHFPGNNMFDVGDWKTNEKFKYYDPFKNYLKEPVEHLSQCDFNTYALQLSIYAYFYEIMSGMKCRKLFILYYWRDHNIFQVIPLNYLKNDVKLLLEHYKNN